MNTHSLIRRVQRLPLLWWAATLVVAIIAGTIVTHGLTGARKVAAQYQQMTDVVIADRPLQAGEVVKAGDTTVQKRPVAFAPDASPATDPQGHVVTTDIPKGGVLTTASIAPGGAGPVTGLLKAGQRAVRVQTGDASLNLRTGDAVDVIGAYGSDKDSDALVLAPGAKVIETGDRFITVAVSTQEAPRVALASTQNKTAIAMAPPVPD